MGRIFNLKIGTAQGVTPWIHDDFSSGDLSYTTADGFVWNSSKNVVVSSADAYSGTYSLEFTYGPDVRGEDTEAHQYFTISTDAADAPSEFWMEFMLKIPSNYVHRDETAIIETTTATVDVGSNAYRVTCADPVFAGSSGAITRWQIATLVGAGSGGADAVDRPFAAYVDDYTADLVAPLETSVTDASLTIELLVAYRSTNNKLLAIWAENYDGYETEVLWVSEFERTDDETSHIRYSAANGEGETRNVNNSFITRGDVIRAADIGNWVQYRFHAKAGTVAGQDGQYQIWRDGTLIADLPSDWIAAEGAGYDYYRRGYLLGWANSGFTPETVFYLDDFKVYNTDPGW